MAARITLIRYGAVVATSAGAELSADEPLKFGKGWLVLRQQADNYFVAYLTKEGQERYCVELSEGGEFYFDAVAGHRLRTVAEERTLQRRRTEAAAREQQDLAALNKEQRQGQAVWYSLRATGQYHQLLPRQEFVGEEIIGTVGVWQVHGGTVTRVDLGDGIMQVTIMGAEWAVFVTDVAESVVVWGDPTAEFFARLAALAPPL